MKSKESIFKNKLAWAVIAELLILAIAGILEPSFFHIEYNQTTGMFFGSLFTSRINARFGTKRTGLLSGLVTTAALSLFFIMQNIQTGFLAMALVGIGIAIMNATCVGHVSLATTDDTKGSIMSAYSAIFRAGQALSPIICGFYFQMTGSSGLFGTAALLALALSFWAASVFSLADRIEHRTGIL